MIQFKGRELSHPEMGQAHCSEFAKRLEDVARVEQFPRLEGQAHDDAAGPEVARGTRGFARGSGVGAATGASMTRGRADVSASSAPRPPPRTPRRP